MGSGDMENKTGVPKGSQCLEVEDYSVEPSCKPYLLYQKTKQKSIYLRETERTAKEHQLPPPD